MIRTVLDNEKLHSDIIKKLNSLGQPQRYLERHKGFSRSTLWRLQRGSPITMETFFILTDWLNIDKVEYFKSKNIF